MLQTNNQFEILTPDGFKDFDGVQRLLKKEGMIIKFASGTHLQCTCNHKLETTKGFVLAESLCVGDEVFTSVGKTKVEELSFVTDETYYYDPINVGENHVYFSNNVVSHNCEFLSSEALLIDPKVLLALTDKIRGNLPKFVYKDVIFWDEVKRGTTYLVGVDPATGKGNDFSVITVYEFPSMKQIAEYRSNTMSTNDLYTTLKNVLLKLEEKDGMVYFSVEANGVGEGVISLYEADETLPPNSEFVSEDKKRGMVTTSRTKMRACVNFKEMLERGAIQIQSPILLAELKSYIRHRGAYSAQEGATDDCVSATLVVVRLIEEIASYDQSAFDKLYSGDFEHWEWEGNYNEDNPDDQPMPFISV